MTGPHHDLLYMAIALALTGCGLNEFRERSETLEKLCATNAPLSAVESTLGVRFSIERLEPQDASTRAWNVNPWQQRIAEKRSKASAVGHTSTTSMQTWIFLNDKGKLVDFEVGGNERWEAGDRSSIRG